MLPWTNASHGNDFRRLVSYRAGVWHYRILPDFFYQVRFHDGGEWHEGAPRKCWHWSCASTFCKNPWKTPNVEYYTLTKVGSAPKTVQDAYLKVLGKRKEDVLKFQEAGHLLNALVVWQEIKFRGLAKRQIY